MLLQASVTSPIYRNKLQFLGDVAGPGYTIFARLLAHFICSGSYPRPQSLVPCCHDSTLQTLAGSRANVA